MTEQVAVIESKYVVHYVDPDSGITVGGTQRYVTELSKLLVSRGYKVYIYSYAIKNAVLEYGDNCKIVITECKNNYKINKVFSKKVYDFCKSVNANLVIYSDLELTYWNCYPNSIALQHGIDWDSPGRSKRRPINNYIYLKACRNVSKIICVDTNYINWSRIRDKYFFDNPGKYCYIPNFANLSDFEFVNKEWDKEDEFVLLYPRRLVAHRGADIFIQMCEQLHKDGYKIKPILAFEDYNSDKVNSLLKNCKCDYMIIHPKMSEISEVYKKTFLSFVPTKWSEGTSLSAIESMCSGCPVISSDVGGLGNLIIPEFNGIITTPTVEAFVNETKRLLDNPSIRNRMSKNCASLRDCFGTDRWKKQVNQVIDSLVNE